MVYTVDMVYIVDMVYAVYADTGNVKLIFYCGEIGICPAVQRGTPL